MADTGSRRFGRAVAVFSCLACLTCVGGASPAAEAPPAQGTLLHFQKTLSIQSTPRGRIFSETRRAEAGETLKGILTKDYGVAEDALGALVEAFRAINPGVDPNRLPTGQTVRVPFKVEESPTPDRIAPAAPAETAYTVRRGESLWRILKNRFKVAKDAMPKALAAVARANPTLRNLDHLVQGQRLVEESFPAGASAPTIVLPPCCERRRSAIPPGVALAKAEGHETGIAEYVIGAMIALTRDFVRVDSSLRAGRWESQWAPGVPPPPV